MGRSSKAKKPIDAEKVKFDGRTDGRTDGPTKRGAESRSTRLKTGNNLHIGDVDADLSHLYTSLFSSLLTLTLLIHGLCVSVQYLET